MQVIPLTAAPSQTLSAGLNGQSVQINLYQLGTGGNAALYMDVISNGTQIITARICRAYGGQPNTTPPFLMKGRRYWGFQGDLLFIDTQSTAAGLSDPVFSGLGTRWQLMYFSPSDLASAGL